VNEQVKNIITKADLGVTSSDPKPSTRHLTGESVKKFRIRFSFVKIEIVREFLELFFRTNMQLPFEFELERVIDDFVLMCFFVGNDFLPHLPALDIRAGGIEALIYLYKLVLPTMGGYITNEGIIDLDRLQTLLNQISQVETHLLYHTMNDK
jgi:5'-3' exonuclease